MMLINWLLVALGLLVFIDGVGSVLIGGGQYHNVWFDGERWLRAVMGLAIVALGAMV
jgi:hypothetical protein